MSTMNRTATLQRVQHVSLPRPRGREDEARRFYGEILGLEEIAPPATLAHMDLIWYRIGDNELHLFPGDGASPHPAQHLCLQTDDVAALREHMQAEGVETSDDIAIPNRPRFFARDPFDNLIEFTAIHGPYTEG